MTTHHDPATCRDGDHYGQCSGPTRAALGLGRWDRQLMSTWHPEGDCPDAMACPLHRVPVVIDNKGPVPGDPDCPFCHGEGDCLECDPETARK